jgi:hypothetical protein
MKNNHFTCHNYIYSFCILIEYLPLIFYNYIIIIDYFLSIAQFTNMGIIFTKGKIIYFKKNIIRHYEEIYI